MSDPAVSREAEPIETPVAAGPGSARPASPHHHHPVGVLPAIQSLLNVLIVALFLTTFTVQPIRIPSSSMEPTLLVGDFLLLDRQIASGDDLPFLPPTGIERGDVAVFHDPVDDPSVHLVKRVIGLPGDRIRLKKNVVYVNGRPLQESYTVFRRSMPDGYRDDFPNLNAMDAAVRPEWWIRLRHLVQDGEITVPKGDYFVLGDNRNESDDSRYWGFVPRSYIVGEPIVVYFSWREPQDGVATNGKNLVRWDRTFQVVR